MQLSRVPLPRATPDGDTKSRAVTLLTNGLSQAKIKNDQELRAEKKTGEDCLCVFLAVRENKRNINYIICLSYLLVGH